MINFILGKSKTGKTTHIYDMINQDIVEDKNVILFVPSQCRAIAEKEYMKILNKSGVIGVNITTVSEFVKENLKIKNLHIDEKYMSKLDRKILITKVIKENPNLFDVFDKVKRYPGFLDVLDIYMDLFRKNDITLEKYNDVSFEDKRIDKKFKELLNIYQKYIEKMQSDYIDSVDEVELFLKNYDVNNLENTTIYFDGYNNFNSNEYKFLDFLMKNKKDITISLNTDIARIEDIFNSNSIFEISNTTYKKVCKIANRNNQTVENIVKYDNIFKIKEDIKYMANNVFDLNDNEKEKIKLENIKFSMHTNILKEVKSIADTISKKIKEGYRFSDFAIYTTNVDEYEKTITRVFYENNLNSYIAKSRNLTESLIVKYIQSILNLANRGLNLELIFDILKLGITSIELKDIYMLENYMREFNLNKYLVNNKFTLNTQDNKYDLEKLNEIKNKIVNEYLFVSKMNNITCKEYIQIIYEHMSSNNIFSNYSNMLSFLEGDSIDLDKENFEAQVWDELSNIFNSVIRVYKNEKISIDEFNNIFNLVIKDVKIKTLPPTKDQIEIVDINSSKVEPKKIAFFIGVVEGKFPKNVDEDIFFTDNELEKLHEKDVDVRETTITKLNMGFFNIYEALNNVSELLYISIPSSTIDGKATRKSSLITLMEQISSFNIEGEVVDSSLDNSFFNIYSKDELFMWFVKNIKCLDDEKKDIQFLYSLYEYFKENNKYLNILNFKKDDSNLSSEIIDKIYGKEFKSSVSRLELYKKCPFSYFMQYILKVNPNKEAKINVLELGSFMHSVLEQFSKRLLLKNVKWQEILDSTLEDIEPNYYKILEEIIEDTIEKNLSKQKQSVKYMVLKRKLINTMVKVIKTIAISYNQSDFEPYGYEIEFKDDSIFLPMQIQVSKDRIMKIIGKIDRVDILNYNDENYVRIVDYKSSSKDLKLENIKEGISLQLISYLMCFMENKNVKNIKPAGILYFNLSDKLVALSQYEQNNENIKKILMKKLKMNGIFLKDLEILNKMDRNFESDSSNSLIDITTRALKGESKKALSEDEFEELCKETKNVLGQIGKNISDGIVKIAPDKKQDYCKYCNYSSTCRKNITV